MADCAKILNGPTIIAKGSTDSIFFQNGNEIVTVTVDRPSSAKRCGGQGDILAGVMAELLSIKKWDLEMHKRCELACEIVRSCAHLSGKLQGRSMTAKDMLLNMYSTLKEFS